MRTHCDTPQARKTHEFAKRLLYMQGRLTPQTLIFIPLYRTQKILSPPLEIF